MKALYISRFHQNVYFFNYLMLFANVVATLKYFSQLSSRPSTRRNHIDLCPMRFRLLPAIGRQFHVHCLWSRKDDAHRQGHQRTGVQG